MGSWGYGPLDNDTAWDAVDLLTNWLLQNGINVDNDLPKITYQDILNLLCTFGVSAKKKVGVAAYLLNRGANPLYIDVDEDIDELIESIPEQGWRDPQERLNALCSFKKNLAKDNIAKKWIRHVCNLL
jgi:hypothetical protein